MDERSADFAWSIVLAASTLVLELERRGSVVAFSIDDDAQLHELSAGHSSAMLAWHPDAGWQSRLAPDDPRAALLDLYLPICTGTRARPVTVGHLGQSLDGFIATQAGDSQFVTGNDNLVHLHRMRALCDVVVVGAGTVATDDPQLTTRHVAGPNPLRAVFDPARRLHADYKVFTDGAAETVYICGASRIAPGETHIGRAPIVGISESGQTPDVVQLLGVLRSRGCARVFVEGGGVTVSAFLEANALDRLQIAIAPLLIGAGRPAIRMPPRAHLSECLRPSYRVFRMGGDVLFDCDLNGGAAKNVVATDTLPSVTRVI